MNLLSIFRRHKTTGVVMLVLTIILAVVFIVRFRAHTRPSDWPGKLDGQVAKDGKSSRPRHLSGDSRQVGSPNREGSVEDRVRAVALAADLKTKRINLNSLLSDFSISHPEAVMEALLEHSPPEYRAHDLLRLFQILAGSGEIEKGAELLDRLDPGSDRSNTIRGFWMAASPIPADLFLRHFDSADLPEDREAMLNALKQTQSQNRDLLKLVVARAPDETSQFINRQIQLAEVAVLGVDSMSEALKLLPSDQGDHSEDRLWDYYIVNLAKNHGDSMVMEEIEKRRELLGEARATESMRRLILIALTKSPQTAAKLVDSMGESDYRSEAVKLLTASWLQSNSMEASKWVQSLTDNDKRRPAIEEIVKFLQAKGDSAGAESWQKEINDLEGP